MKKKSCEKLKLELRHYLHEQQHEMARLLKNESQNIQTSIDAAGNSLDKNKSQRSPQHRRSRSIHEDTSAPVADVNIPRRINGTQRTRSRLVKNVCIGLAIPLILLIILLIGTIFGLTGQAFPWFYTPKVYY